MKLSVAMITYNHEPYIAQAIESVLAQKVNFEYEIVIGEDCSTDGTRAVLMALHHRYHDRIRLLLRDQNIGAQRNFTETIEACQGDYLALLEGDDYWIATDKLQRQIAFLDAHPECAICCGRARAQYEAGTQNLDTKWDVYPERPAGPYTIEDILKGNFVVPCTAMLRRELVPPFPEWFFEMKLGDWPLFAMAARFGTIDLMDEVVAMYRVHPGGMWSSMANVTRYEETARMLSALDKELQCRYTSTVRATIANSYLGMASISRSRGRRMETAKHFINYIRNGGWRRPGSARTIAGMVAYGVIGSWYKVFLRTKSASRRSELK